MPVPSQADDHSFGFNVASGSTNESSDFENWACKDFNVFELMHDIQGDDSAIGLDVDNSKVQDDYDNNGLIRQPSISAASSFDVLPGDLSQLSFGNAPLDLSNHPGASAFTTPPATEKGLKRVGVPCFPDKKTSLKQEPSLRTFVKPAAVSGLRCVGPHHRKKPETDTIVYPKDEPADHDYEPVKKKRAYRRVTPQQVKQDPNYRKMRQKNTSAVHRWRVNAKLARQEQDRRLAFLEQEYLKDTRYLQQLQERNLTLLAEAARMGQSCCCEANVHR
ncbi:hypothetical protein AAVH_17566 [Aphelenchoides avenae]|nr:hypothetical protein AAVH_17566 [Aphelenchus avenae]